jgi:hypothetical protein
MISPCDYAIQEHGERHYAYGGASQILEDGQGHMASLSVHLLLIHGHIVLRNAKGKETHLACGLAQRYVSEGANHPLTDIRFGAHFDVLLGNRPARGY